MESHKHVLNPNRWTLQVDPNKLNKYFAIAIERTRVTAFDVVSDLLDLVDSIPNQCSLVFTKKWFINGVNNVNWAPYRDWKADVSNVSPSSERILSDEGLTLETSSFQYLYGGQLTLSTLLINKIFVYHSPTDAAPQFHQKLIPLA